MVRKKEQVNKPTQVEGGTMSAFNDVLDRPEPDKVLDVQLLALDTVAGGCCIIAGGLQGIFRRGKNNDAGLCDTGGIFVRIADATELAAADGKMKGSIWRFDSQDFSESRQEDLNGG